MQEQDKQVDSVDQVEENIAPESPSVVGGVSLEEKLASAEAKIVEMQDAFMRAKAEGENIRRRAQEDISKAYKFCIRV